MELYGINIYIYIYVRNCTYKTMDCILATLQPCHRPLTNIVQDIVPVIPLAEAVPSQQRLEGFFLDDSCWEWNVNGPLMGVNVC